MIQDYTYFKTILKTLRDHPAHQIKQTHLIQKMGLNLDCPDETDKFIGHIKLLYDEFLFECDDSPENLGFRMMSDGSYIFSDVDYRLTNRGYEFLNALENDTIFNKIKKYALHMAVQLAPELLSKVILDGDLIS